MSMVKAYHGKQCTDLQFCCSNWTESNSLSKNDLLTKHVQMEEGNWLWDSELSKPSPDHGSNKFMKDLNHLKYLPLDPPLQFQDNPTACPFIKKFADDFISKLMSDVLLVSCKITWSIPCSQDCHMSGSLPIDDSALWNGLRLCWTPELPPCNKSQNTFPGCLSASHNSLSTGGSTTAADETTCMKSALSHDALTSKQISDMYNVPFGSDMYSVPVDMVRNRIAKPSNRSETSCSLETKCCPSPVPSSDHMLSTNGNNSSQKVNGDGRCNRTLRKSHPTGADSSSAEPIHVTVEEVRRYLHTLYSRTGEENPENKNLQETIKRLKNPFKSLQTNNSINQDENGLNGLKLRNRYIIPARSKRAKENLDTAPRDYNKMNPNERFKKAFTCRPSFPTNIKETLCNIFRIKKLSTSDHCLWKRDVGSRSDEIGIRLSGYEDQNPPSPITKPTKATKPSKPAKPANLQKRALPPLPKFENNHREIVVANSTPPPSPEEVLLPSSPKEDLPPPPPSSEEVRLPPPSHPGPLSAFASSIEKVKDCGWYWGPISGEEAERILLHEPDGSFIVRDSSDDYHIFSLTFKLNSLIRHVRIEHDQGNFSFGSSRFKSHTIVDFIESAVEHSRSGRYLFFLHRRPVLGPMRVQLLHPVSRFKKVHSLQHLCRFVVLKMVRTDLIQTLPLPKTVLDYLTNRHYYMEHMNYMYDEESDSIDQSDLSSRSEDLDDELLPIDIHGG